MATASGSSCRARKEHTHTWELLSTSSVLYFWQLSREAGSPVRLATVFVEFEDTSFVQRKPVTSVTFMFPLSNPDVRLIYRSNLPLRSF